MRVERTHVRKPLIYLSGPLSKPEQGANVNRACKLWDELTRAGLLCLCPHWSQLQHLLIPEPYEFWMQYDFQLIRHCDAVFRMEGESSGADREVALAESFNIPVFYDKGALIQWHQTCTTGFAEPLK